MIRLSSPNHQPRPSDTPVDMLILHYTGMETAEAALARLCDPAAEVSAHYLIDEDGSVYALVDEERRAWHAGVSFWRGQHDINSRSIGIELVNPGHAFGYRPFPGAQMEALAELAQAILTRYPIPMRNVVGHSDVAPLRKQDPGELFDWAWLARQGIGLWPASPERAAGSPGVGHLPAMLGQWGYDVSDAAAEKAALVAFQRHFRPSNCEGAADIESVVALQRLLHMVGQDIKDEMPNSRRE